jgi:hypothetical protein
MRQEEELSDTERRQAWDTVYDAIHYGDARARPVMMDQRVLIMIVADLLQKSKAN